MHDIVLDAIGNQTFRHASIQHPRVIYWDEVEAETHSRCTAIDPEIDSYFYDYFDDVKKVEIREDLKIERQRENIDSLLFELHTMRRVLLHSHSYNYPALLRSVEDSIARVNKLTGKN